MLYQNLITGARPYVVMVGDHIHYNVMHRHAELELHYCLSGTYDIEINNVMYTLTPGKLAIAGSLVPHRVPNCDSMRSVILEFGPGLLKEHFPYFAGNSFEPVCDLTSENFSEYFPGEMKQLLEEVAELGIKPEGISELLLTSNVYRIAYHVADYLGKDECSGKIEKKDYIVVDNIVRSIQLIYEHYGEEISLEEAAACAGYGKTSFCRYFKKITGYSFHNFLNQYRVENACHYLAETRHSLAEIAELVGFADSKVLCRVFKANLGMTPGEYRQKQKEEV